MTGASGAPGVIAVADGAVPPDEAVAHALATIDRLDGRLGAWQSVHADEARRAGAAATEARSSGHRVGPFHGVPFALKDIVDVEGRLTGAGSAALAARRSPTTAVIARRLLAGGGILVGKTKTVELALGGWGTNERLGTPWNPWDADRHRAPGGSSSGSAVAVASGMVPCAIGTDTGGSVRLPASFCGIVGLKTTEGLLPTDGIVPLSHTLDTPGPLARTVHDAALMFDVLTGRSPVEIDDDRRRTAGLYRALELGVSGLRLGVLADGERHQLAPAVAHDYDLALDRLNGLGADLVPFAPPLDFVEMMARAFVIVTAEAWYHHGHLFGDPAAPMGEAVRARALPGQDHSATRYIDAQLRRIDDRAAFDRALGPLDGWLTPTTPTTAPPVDTVDEASTPAHFTRAANYLGLCAVSVPSGLDGDGLPTGLQIMGRGGAEALVLRVAATHERARGPLARPPLS
ncbi:MAG: amidase [Acidimicrobiales bacterium]